MVYFVSLDPGVYLAGRMYLLGGARKMPKLARKVFKCGDCQEKSKRRKNLGFTDLSPFGREMLNVKVATNKRREQFEIYGVPSPLEGNAKCPFCSGNSGKLSKNQLKDNSTIKEGRVLQ